MELGGSGAGELLAKPVPVIKDFHATVLRGNHCDLASRKLWVSHRYGGPVGEDGAGAIELSSVHQPARALLGDLGIEHPQGIAAFLRVGVAHDLSGADPGHPFAS